jgi:uncharacterized damage-inducible protein DinB
MGSHERDYLVIEPSLSKEPEIGRWLWALQDTRRRTIGELGNVSPATIDWLPESSANTIGTMLYHIADIEADWLYAEVLEQPIPAAVAALFPFDTRDAQGHLIQVAGLSLEQHVRRLETVRDLLLDVYQQMDLGEFRRIRSLPAYDVTPEWVLYHLMQHEAQHYGQIVRTRRAAAGQGLV